jgi:hypothetical protein
MDGLDEPLHFFCGLDIPKIEHDVIVCFEPLRFVAGLIFPK